MPQMAQQNIQKLDFQEKSDHACLDINMDNFLTFKTLASKKKKFMLVLETKRHNNLTFKTIIAFNALPYPPPN